MGWGHLDGVNSHEVVVKSVRGKNCGLARSLSSFLLSFLPVVGMFTSVIAKEAQ